MAFAAADTIADDVVFVRKPGDHYAQSGGESNDGGRKSATEDISKSPDYTSIIKHPTGEKIFAITQYTAPLPSSLYLSELTQGETGSLALASTKPVEVMNGLWYPSAAHTTAWNSHLGGETKEPDAIKLHDPELQRTSFADVSTWKGLGGDNGDVPQFLRYFGQYRAASEVHPSAGAC